MASLVKRSANGQLTLLLEADDVGGPLSVPVEVKRYRGARYIRIRFGKKNQVVLSLPTQCALRDGIAFLESRTEWIREQLKSKPQDLSLLHYFDSVKTVSGLGFDFEFRLLSTVSKGFYVFSETERSVEVRVPEGPDADAILKRSLMLFAKKVIPKRVHYFAEKHGLAVGRVSVRDQSSRWGSCSSSGTISLNWRLVLLPTELHDHVILHELAHVSEMNHSERFWSLLRTYDPQSDSHNKRLDKEASQIIALGR